MGDKTRQKPTLFNLNRWMDLMIFIVMFILNFLRIFRNFVVESHRELCVLRIKYIVNWTFSFLLLQ